MTKKGVYYLLTIKCNTKRFAAIEELDNVFQRVKDKMPKGSGYEEFVPYELDSLRRLHLHTIVSCPRQPFYKRLQQKGYTVHMKAIGLMDVDRVRNYCMKNSDCTSMNNQNEWASYAHYNYLFDESSEE